MLGPVSGPGGLIPEENISVFCEQAASSAFLSGFSPRPWGVDIITIIITSPLPGSGKEGLALETSLTPGAAPLTALGPESLPPTNGALWGRWGGRLGLKSRKW